MTFVLEALKFAAILLGTVSGAVGTLTDTRDKNTGQPTVWGRRIVALIVLAGLIAIVIQGIETYRKSKSDKAEEARRTAADAQIRHLTVPQDASVTPRQTFARSVRWVVASPETVGSFSAACYYFARELKKTVNVPKRTAVVIPATSGAEHYWTLQKAE